jgi:predicted metal-binding membrane protein
MVKQARSSHRFKPRRPDNLADLEEEERSSIPALIAAGVYQWTPLKDFCLAQCQSPLQFLMRHGGFQNHPRGCPLLGLRHGGYCVGCCWVLMAFLFVGGAMNVPWIALLALLVLLEKLTPVGRWIARAAGVACVAAGAWLLVSLPQ